LGERLICIQEVVGSTPSGSTIAFMWRYNDRKKNVRFRSKLRDICHRKGKIDPAAMPLDPLGLAWLLQPIK
jgi:hypothetical protein